MPLTLLNNFKVQQIKDNIYDIISTRNGNFIVSSQGSSELYICHMDGEILSRIVVSDRLCDVTWTADGKHIVYTTSDTQTAVLMTSTGDIMTRTKMKNPRCLSLSADGVVYLADGELGIYRLTQRNKWTRMFRPPDKWHCLQVVKVSPSAQADVFWTIERLHKTDTCHLRIYKVRKEQTGLTWSIINSHIKQGIYINLLGCKLAYDGSNRIFMTDCCASSIHLFTGDGEYHGEILTLCHGIVQPFGLDVDTERKLLMIGQWNLVNVFKIHGLHKLTLNDNLLFSNT